MKKCVTIKDLYGFLRDYSQAHWETPAQATLSTVFAAAQSKVKGFDSRKAQVVSKKIEDALYAGVATDANALKKEISILIFENNPLFRDHSRTSKTRTELPGLNPS